jgi:hypothetical protein
MGAVAWAMRQRSVSHPRSSNRTCGFPASGSPTGFTVRHTKQITARKRHLRARSSVLISRIWTRTALRVSTFSRVQTPCLKLPLRSPCGPPDSLPCAYGSVTAPLPLPAYKGDRLAFAPHTGGLWPDLRAVVLCRPGWSLRVFVPALPVVVLCPTAISLRCPRR